MYNIPSSWRHCECEHISHHNLNRKTSSGKVGHHEDTLFAPEALKETKTIYGKFFLCQQCIDDCMKDFIKE